MDILEVLRPLLYEQRGYVHVRSATLLGVSRGQLRRAVVGGRLDRVRRGVYGFAAQGDRLRGVQLATQGVVSHATAAQALGIGLAFDDNRVHLTFPRHYGCPPDAWYVTHRSDLGTDESVLVQGVVCTTPLRTVLDLARSLTLAEAVAAADSALRDEMFALAELATAVAAISPRTPGIRRVRRVLALVDPSAGSVLESILRVLLVESGLGPDETQYVVRDRRGRRILRADFAWIEARLVVEADGFEHHGANIGSWKRDLRRGNLLAVGRWWLLRFTWDDVFNHPDVVVAQVREMLVG